MISIIITAAGKQERWKKDMGFLKQLADVGGEPVMGRTIRQIKQRNFPRPWVATHVLALERAAARFGAVPLYPSHRNVLCETVLNTQRVWGDTTIIMLGDVCYSRRAMDTILFDDSERPFVYYADSWETFAIRFDRSEQANVIKHLQSVIDDEVYPGSLRQFFARYCGHKTGSIPMLPSMTYIPDYTKDFDTREDYVSFRREIENTNRLDDLKDGRR